MIAVLHVAGHVDASCREFAGKMWGLAVERACTTEKRSRGDYSIAKICSSSNLQAKYKKTTTVQL